MSAPETPRIGDFVWHIHHGILCEPLTDPMEDRIAFIKKDKPSNEVETRLRLMKPVRNVRALLADAALSKACADLSTARAALSTAGADLSRAVVPVLMAEAIRSKAGANWLLVRADLSKAYADWSKAAAAVSRADAGWTEANADWREACSGKVIMALHAKECPNCPWNGRTIFP